MPHHHLPTQPASAAAGVGASESATPADTVDKAAGQAARAYHLPEFVLEEENYLLEQYQTKNLGELTHRIHDEIWTTITLMRNFDEEQPVKGQTLKLLGDRIARPLGLLSRVGSLLSEFAQHQTSGPLK